MYFICLSQLGPAKNIGTETIQYKIFIKIRCLQNTAFKYCSIQANVESGGYLKANIVAVWFMWPMYCSPYVLKPIVGVIEKRFPYSIAKFF